MKKLLFTFVLALLATVSVWAQTFTAGNLKYEVTDAAAKTVELTGYETKPEGALTIPATVTNGGTTYSVTAIGYRAFDGCEALTSVTIPNTVKTIGVYAFYNCKALAAVSIPDGVTVIGLSSFDGCEALTSITIPESVTEIGAKAFSRTSLTVIDIPNGVKKIGDSLFFYCYNLTQVNFPASLTTIGKSLFGYCESLLQINVDSRNTAYCSENGILFSKDKTKLIAYPAAKPETSYTVPNGVTTIGEHAFYYVYALKQITIPDGVTNIGEYALFETFETMTVHAVVPPTLDGSFDEVFDRCKRGIPVYVPQESLTAYKAADGWKEFINLKALGQISFTAGNLKYEVTDAAAKTVQLVGYATKPTGALTIPATVTYGGTTYSVTSIGYEAFYECDNITSVTIPDGVTTIGEYAFGSCRSMTEIVIPDNVTVIGNSAFYECTALKAVNIPKSVTAIRYQAFDNCRSLTEIAIPDNVTSIGEYAFYSCESLTNVTIGSGVTSIDSFTFMNCSSLTEITVLAAVPPTITSSTFYGLSLDISVYVPAESLAAYQTADVWKEFTNLQAIPSGLDTPSMPESIRIYGGMLHNPEGLRVTLYDLAGRIAYDGRAAIVELPAGVYVVRCNGASRKAVF